MSHSHPPVDYPVFGLDATWHGPRWLEFVEGQVGDPVWATWLMHGWQREASPTCPWVDVGTMPAERFARLMSRDQDLPRAVAFAAAFSLVNRTMPELDDEQRHRYLPRVVRLAEDKAKDHEAWRRITWLVDGDRVPARAWEWAGGWAAFTTAVPGVALAAVGAGTSPDGLGLAEVGDGSAYHFDVGAPVEFADTLEASALAALGPAVADDDRSWPWHDDQLQLLEGQA